MSNHTRSIKTARLIVALVVCLSACAMQRAKIDIPFEPAKPRLIWQPVNIASQNLYFGPGGAEHFPSGNFKFVREIPEGASPKFDVVDEQGVRWRVKPGDEARSETAATRLLWAIGYFADEDYFLPELRVEGLKKNTLTRGQIYVTEDEKIVGVRLERHSKDHKKVGNWDWFDNPFVGTKELNGLRTMMALLNNWDLKTLNNAIVVVEGNEYRYLVSDVGSSLGKPGTSGSRTKDNLFDYRQAKFIRRTTPQTVDFDMIGRRVPLDVMFAPVYFQQARRQKFVGRIPREHARWVGGLLAQLSDQQLRDCFRAAGYMPEEIDGYTIAVKQRIAQLNRL